MTKRVLKPGQPGNKNLLINSGISFYVTVINMMKLYKEFITKIGNKFTIIES